MNARPSGRPALLAGLSLALGLFGLRWGLPSRARLERVLPPGLDNPDDRQRLAEVKTAGRPMLRGRRRTHGLCAHNVQRAFGNCAVSNSKCGADGKTDGAAVLAACSSQFQAYESCAIAHMDAGGGG